MEEKNGSKTRINDLEASAWKGAKDVATSSGEQDSGDESTTETATATTTSDVIDAIAEQFEGQPLRHAAPNRARSTGGRSRRSSPGAPGKGLRTMRQQKRNMSKQERQKRLLDARAFKELDTTLQVLGIDGSRTLASQRVTASPHVPLQALSARSARATPGSLTEDSDAASYSSRSSRPSESSSRQAPHVSLQHRALGSAAQPPAALPPAGGGGLSALAVPTAVHAAAPIQRPKSWAAAVAAPPPAKPQSGGSRGESPLDLSVRSREADGQGDPDKLVRLETERETWLANLDNLLEGDFANEDLELAVSLARSKANDLREQLIYWGTPPEATWPAREQRLDWLEFALMEARDIAMGLRQHGALTEGSHGLETYVDIVKDLAVELKGMACLCCDAVAEGLRHVTAKASGADTRRPFQAARRALATVRQLNNRLRSLERLAPPAELGVVIKELGEAALELVLAACDCASTLQDGLLQPSSLSGGAGGHAVTVQARNIQSVWYQIAELAQGAAEEWTELHASIFSELCKLYLRGAQLADEMQRHYRHVGDMDVSLLSDDDIVASHGNGVWGVPRRKGSGALADEDLQAQAWLPPCLHELLQQAEKAADALTHGSESGRDQRGPSAESQQLLDELSGALYGLAQTGLARVSELARDPGLLACWALELLEEQACQAIVFVRDLDRSFLGKGRHGMANYKSLRRGTDHLVNLILRLRRLLKQKRSTLVQGFEDGLPRPLPLSVSRHDSNNSFTSTVSSISSSMIMSRVNTPLVVGTPSLESPTSLLLGTGSSAAALRDLGGISRQSLDSPAARVPAPASGLFSHPGSAVPAAVPAVLVGGRHPRSNVQAPPQNVQSGSPGELAAGLASPSSYRSALSHLPASPNPMRAPAAPPAPLGTAPHPLGAVGRNPSFHSPFEAAAGIPSHTDSSASELRPTDTDGTVSPHSSRALTTPSSTSAGPSPASLEPKQAERVSAPETTGNALTSASPGVSHSYTLRRKPGPKSPFEAAELTPFPSQKSLNAGPSPPRQEAPAARAPRGGQAEGTRQRNGRDREERTAEEGRKGRGLHKGGRARGGTAEAEPPVGALAVTPAVPSCISPVALGDEPLDRKPTWKERLFGKVKKVAALVADAKAGPPICQPHTVTGNAQGAEEEQNGAEEARKGRKFRHHHRHHKPERRGKNGDATGLGRREKGTGSKAKSTDSKIQLPWEGDPFWQIKWSDLQPTLVKKLGSGSFGQVYEAYFHAASMAVKIITLDGGEVEPAVLLRFKQEVDLQRKLSLHPNIVRFLGACCHIPSHKDTGRGPRFGKSPGLPQGITLAIVMELCRFGNLFKLIELARRVSRLPPAVLSGALPPSTPEQVRLKACPGWKLYHGWVIRIELLKHVAAAVEFMHSVNVVHRDLTSYNLLVTDKWEAKVADFNLSRGMTEETVPSSGLVNSPEWSAPERLSGQAYGKAADVFSFGVCMWEMMTLGVPWRENMDKDSAGGCEERSTTEDGPFRDQVFHVMNAVPQGSRLVFPPPADVVPAFPEASEVIELAQECWAQDPKERPCMQLVGRRLDAILNTVKARVRAQKYGPRA